MDRITPESCLMDVNTDSLFPLSDHQWGVQEGPQKERRCCTNMLHTKPLLRPLDGWE